MQSSNPESLMKENAHIVSERNTEKRSEMQSANNQRALSYSNGAAAVFGGRVWPADFSCLLSCRGFVTSAIPFALSNYAIGLVTVQCQGQNDNPDNTYTVLHTDLRQKQGSSVIWCAVRSTAQNGQAVYWREE